MRLTLVHPCIGRKRGTRYIRTWQMEPLAPAVLATLTPTDVEIAFHDDRLEAIPYDAPTDLVAISVETYTARRAYEIASEYRARGVPVVMGGFHATLCPDEVAEHAEAVVVGEAETLWPRVVDDARHGRLEKFYHQDGRPNLAGVMPDRSIFRGKRYLPISLIEAGRGCHFKCDFCAVQTVFGATQTRRPIDDVVAEVRRLAPARPLFFFVDDNITSNPREAKSLYRALAPLKIRWVSQASITLAHDEELLELLVASGCQGVLIGFESLRDETLNAMNKGFSLARGGYEKALENLRRHRIRIYSTFVFGYDHDTPDTFRETIDFARRHAFYISAFNHLTPFPATPLFRRLEAEGRLRFERWWLDRAYRYNMIPFHPRGMSANDLARHCVEARRAFYSWPSIARRAFDPVNRADGGMFRSFFLINAMIRTEVTQRDGYPLGDEAFDKPLLKAN